MYIANFPLHLNPQFMNVGSLLVFKKIFQIKKSQSFSIRYKINRRNSILILIIIL